MTLKSYRKLTGAEMSSPCWRHLTKSWRFSCVSSMTTGILYPPPVRVLHRLWLIVSQIDEEEICNGQISVATVSRLNCVWLFQTMHTDVRPVILLIPADQRTQIPLDFCIVVTGIQISSLPQERENRFVRSPSATAINSRRGQTILTFGKSEHKKCPENKKGDFGFGFV